jgi:nitrite reductase/ring-hydroxylating ferredoxin subunit
MRVVIGPVHSVSDTECVVVGDGRAVVVRVGDELRAFENRCLHQESPIAGAPVRNGVLSCPLHFWRYHVGDGTLIGSQRSLQRFPIDVVDGVAFVLLPDLPPDRPLREQLLARARAYDRELAYEADRAGADPPPPDAREFRAVPRSPG